MQTIIYDKIGIELSKLQRVNGFRFHESSFSQTL